MIIIAIIIIIVIIIMIEILFQDDPSLRKYCYQRGPAD